MAGTKEGELSASQPDQPKPKTLGTFTFRRERRGRIVAEFAPNGDFAIVDRNNRTLLGDVVDANGTKRTVLMEVLPPSPTEPKEIPT